MYPFRPKSTLVLPSATLILTLGVLMTVASGCRLGNRTVSGSNNPDTISGFYGTAPQSLKFCTSRAVDPCADVSTSQVPHLIAAQLSNPVALIIQDLQTGDAVLTAYDGGRTALPIWLSSDNRTLTFVSSYSPQPLWKDSNCKSRTYLDESGEIIPGESIPVPGSTRNTLGRISLHVRVTTVFEESTVDACRTTLQSMANCYQDVTQCGGADTTANQSYQAEVQAVFERYIQAGAMVAADIPTTTRVAYEVQYQ